MLLFQASYNVWLVVLGAVSYDGFGEKVALSVKAGRCGTANELILTENKTHPLKKLRKREERRGPHTGSREKR